MHIIDHRRHQNIDAPKRNKGRTVKLITISFAVLLFLGMVLLTYRFFAPAPLIKPKINSYSRETAQPDIAWPVYGQAAVGDTDSGLLAQKSEEAPRPIASVSKVMTALAIIRQKPLALNQQGPVITLTDTDVDSYNEYIVKDGSVVKITAGEKLTEYQLLQAILLPSANNMADTGARWAFGSVKEYTVFANKLALSLGMKQTTISDASGFSAKTISTAGDLVLLGRAALKEPVLAEIFAQTEASIPVHGSIKNVNLLLGKEEINGIKTGNTEEAGGCFLGSATRTMPDGSKKTLLTAIIGAPTRSKALEDTVPLLRSTQQNFELVNLVKTGYEVGYYAVPWQGNIPVYAKNDLQILVWRGKKVKALIDLGVLSAPASKDQKVGTVTVTGQKNTVDAILGDNITSPSNSWRWQRVYHL